MFVMDIGLGVMVCGKKSMLFKSSYGQSLFNGLCEEGTNIGSRLWDLLRICKLNQGISSSRYLYTLNMTFVGRSNLMFSKPGATDAF